MHPPVVVTATEHLRIWNSQPGAERTSAVAELYAADVVVAEPDASHTGRSGVEEAIDGLHAALPALQLRLTGPIRTAQELSTYSWSLGPPDGPVVVAGRDVLLIEDGIITALYVLIDAPQDPVHP